MNNRNKIITISILLLLIFLSGCTDFFQYNTDNNITYEMHPTQISFHVRYGYQIKLHGTGSTTINYREDVPITTRGIISNVTIHNQLQSKNIKIGDNHMIQWNETFHDEQNIFLGISADIIAESYISSDLNGTYSLTLSELEQQYPSLIKTYCKNQSNNTKIIINPSHPMINQTANIIKNKLDTTNIFRIAKELFIWLKSNTSYQYHINNQHIQSCYETLGKKTGDCDDLSFLYISLCRAVSIPTRFIRGYLITNQNDERKLIPHVWVEFFAGPSLDKWIPVECAGTGDIEAEIHQNFGIEDAHHLRLYTDDGSNESMNRYTNHLFIKYGSGIIIDIQNQAFISDYNILKTEKLCITNKVNRRYC